MLQPRTFVELQQLSRLNAMWPLQYALEARGEMVRGLTWSDLPRHNFPGMFSASGKDLDLLCSCI